MPSGSIGVRIKTRQARDESGRFLGAVESGLEATVMELAATGAGVSRGAAPSRTGRLRGSIEMFGGGLVAGWRATAPYAVYQDQGTGPKGRPGQFLTNREDFWAIGPVGPTPATHFMEAGLAVVKARAPGVLASHMP